MTAYNKDQEYTLKVVTTDGKTKEIKMTPEKNMSKPEMIMTLKSKYKNFFKLIESKTVKKESYTVTSYFDEKLRGVEDSTNTNDWDVVVGFAHDHLMKGSYVKIKNIETGKSEVINPADYEKDFDGEFVFGPDKLEETYSVYTTDYNDDGTINSKEWYMDFDTYEEAERARQGLQDKGMDAWIEGDELEENKKVTEEEDLEQVADDVQVAREDSENSTLDIDQVSSSIDVLLVDEQGAIDGYNSFLEQAKAVLSEELYNELDNQIQEIIDDEKEHIEKLNTIKNTLNGKENPAEDVSDEVELQDVESDDTLEESKKKIESTEKLFLDGKLADSIAKDTKVATDNKDEASLKIAYQQLDKMVTDFYDKREDKDVIADVEALLNKCDITLLKVPTLDTLNAKFNFLQVVRKEISDMLVDIAGYDALYENEDKSNNDPVIVVDDMGKGYRFKTRDDAIYFYKRCVAGTDPNGSENYRYSNILYSLQSTNKSVVYDIDEEEDYDYWVSKGKPTRDVTDEEVKDAYLKEGVTMKEEEISDIDEKVVVNGFVGEPLSKVLSYLGDGHDIADRDYDCVVWFPLVEDEDNENSYYDQFIQGLAQRLQVAERFDVDDVTIITNIVDWVTANKDSLLDIFEVTEDSDDVIGDLVCDVMPNVIAGYTSDNVYKLLLNTVKGGK